MERQTDSLLEGSENQHVAGNGDRDGHADEVSDHESYGDEVSDCEGHADEVLDQEGHGDEVSDHEGFPGEVSEHQSHADEVSDHESHADEVSAYEGQADEVSDQDSLADEASASEGHAGEVSEDEDESYADEVSDSEGRADEVSEEEGQADEASGERKNSLGKWRKGHPCYLVAKSLASLCPCPEAPWKAELHCHHCWCLARELSKQRSTQEAAWLLLKAYSRMREERQAFKRAFFRTKTELLSQRSPRGIKRTGWPQQPPGRKMKAYLGKQGSLGLNPSKKDALKGFQKRAPKQTLDFSLLAKRLLSSDRIPLSLVLAPRRRSPWSSSTGDVAGRKNKDLKFQRFSAQLKRKPWEARKAAFKRGSLWSSSDGVMAHGAVGVKPHWRRQKKSSDPSVFQHQPQKSASSMKRKPLEVATISSPPYLAIVEQTGAWRSPSRLQVTSGSIPEVETPESRPHRAKTSRLSNAQCLIHGNTH